MIKSDTLPLREFNRPIMRQRNKLQLASIWLSFFGIYWFFRSSDQQGDVQQHNPLSHNPNLPKALFESPEHQAVANIVKLRFPSRDIYGSDFYYATQNGNITYGDIVALAGDYYFRWTIIGNCAPSISKSWDYDHETGIKVALDNAKLLATDEGGFLTCVLNIITEQDRDIDEALRIGRDPAQVINKRIGGDNKGFALCTNFGYAYIALCNYDHFGEDAIKAYTAAHTAALRQAQTAWNTSNEDELRFAYFLEGYAQHFLTDIFSSGHIRNPRRTLHSRSFSLSVFPGDRCSQKQHDEDSSAGLWVTNQLGESWAAYGDKHFFQGRSAKNVQMTFDACQMGVDEVYATFMSGEMPAIVDYAALQKVPIGDKTLGLTNFVPLFELNKNKSMLHFREAVDDRADSNGTTLIDTIQGNSGWATLRDMIDNSGPAQNLYVFAKAFASGSNFLHFGVSDGHSIITNTYGNVNAGNFGTFWSMQSQNRVLMPQNVSWTSIETVHPGMVSLVGRIEIDGWTMAHHLGLGVDQGAITVLWSKQFDDYNDGLELGQVIYGTFDGDLGDVVMAKVFYDAGSFQTNIEIWAIARENPLQNLALESNLPRLNFLVSHEFTPDGLSSTLVGYAQEGPDAVWTFLNWRNEYYDSSLTTIGESNITTVAQELLSDSTTNRIIRISRPRNNTITIDTYTPGYNRTTDTFFTHRIASQKFNVTWNTTDTDDHTFFLHDVNNNGIPDLVIYTNPHNIHPTVIVFPSLSNGIFNTPIISRITLDPNIGDLLVGEFMHTISVDRASYTYVDSNVTTENGAVVEWFDNYGVVGMRILAPRVVGTGGDGKGQYEYELKGQDPSIAGQRSVVMSGWRDGGKGHGKGRKRRGKKGGREMGIVRLT